MPNAIFYLFLSNIFLIILFFKRLLLFLAYTGNIFLMNKVEIGHIIQSRRNSLSIKQEDLAEMTGITSKTIYLIESGNGNPSIDTLNKLLETLGLEISVDVKKLNE